MRKLALISIPALALTAPAPALAHATLRETSPAFRAELVRGPAVVRLHFDQAVTLPSIRVLDAQGRGHAAVAHARGHDVVVRVRRLRRGVYTVRWHATSPDSHTVAGVFTFGVRVPAPPPTEAFGASGPTPTEHAVRWLYFLSLALLLGGLGFRLVCLRGVVVPARVEQRLAVLTGAGVVGMLEVGILAF